MPESFVLDCSVAAKWVFPEQGSEAALKFFERYAAREIVLIAPDLLLAEFASLVTKRVRRKQLSSQQALEGFQLMVRVAPRLYHMRPRILPALELSIRRQLSLWDCVYLALALEHGCPVVTADQRLFRAGRGLHPSVQL